MTLLYPARLVCLALASFFVLHCFLGLVVRCAVPWCLRLSERYRPATAARFLLIVRFFPPLAALLIVGSLCIPSYLWLEEPGSIEAAGFACLTAASLTLLSLSVSVLRAVGAMLRTRHFVDHNALQPSLLLSGILRPRLHVSKALVNELPAHGLDAALRHEEAHRDSYDNLKRLLLLLTPDILPFVRLFESLDRHWARFAEWAADDQAVGADRQRALHLAETLIKVARMGVVPAPALPVSLLLTADEDLAVRVNRLLADPPDSQDSPCLAPLFSSLALCLCIIATTMSLHPEVLFPVHDLLELLLH